ncbi:MAG: hypothetical protein QOJ39_415 [Candidatus Eremiobacteraeota bacterium]|nr:hypothetical protein [Candidatus Eremiobacteraeota bacterium]
MRRIVKSLAAVLGVLSLGACGGGGSVLNFDNSSTPDRVIVTVQGGSNIARVLPGAGLPISAVAVKGTQNGVLSNNRFKWSAAVSVGQSYPATTLGTQKPCSTLVYTPAGGTPVAYAPDFGIYIAIDPTNEANIEFIPPTIIPLPSGAPAGSTITIANPVFPPVTGSTNPYCVTVTATPIGGSGSNSGSITVAVVNPLAPLN